MTEPPITAVTSILYKPTAREVLAVSRKLDHADLGLPGGKVELTDANPESAIMRELEEETGLRARVVEHLDVRVETRSGRVCACFRIQWWPGCVHMREGAWVGWVPIERLLEPSCTFGEYNRALFTKLGLIAASSGA
jgi:8-oxo-dGTP pyrophosphatase MutT (NUDIX family)